MRRFWSGILATACMIAGCGGSGGDGREPDDDGPVDTQVLPRADVRDMSRLYPYRADGPYADVLKDCVLIEQAADACTLDMLPFIAQDTPDFTREDILERLLVTHDWMGRRFEQLLTQAPEHMVTLFGSLTSIAIGSTIRPSNYWGGTGGMRIDPDYLWLSVDEKASVSIEEDYRSDYGRELQFWSFGTLRRGGEPATWFYSLTDYTQRTLNDIRLPVFRLLYHELAHAVDFLPSGSFATLDPNLTPSQALDANEQYWLSPQLYLDLPLYDDELWQLAQVSYRGEPASEEQKGFTPAYVGSLMAGDGAAKYYGYSTIREDFATLFATAMIKHDFDVDYHTAFVRKPLDEDDYRCEELIVGWGVRNRIADSRVVPRARWVMESIYGPGSWIDALFDHGLGSQSTMTAGLDWCTNRDELAVTSNRLRGTGPRSLTEMRSRQQLEVERRDYRH